MEEMTMNILANYGVLGWRQPTGAHDAYKIGDKVLHKGQTWVCTLGDGAGLNSWGPGVYGWEVVV